MNNLILILDYVNKMKSEITNNLAVTKISKTEYSLLNAILEELTTFILQLTAINQQIEEQEKDNITNMDEVNEAMLEVIVNAGNKYKNTTKNYQIYMEALEDFLKKLQIKNRLAHLNIVPAIQKDKKQENNKVNNKQSEKEGIYCNYNDNIARTYSLTFKSPN